MKPLSSATLHRAIAAGDCRSSPGCLDLWLLPTLISDSELSEYRQVLSEPERERAARFRFDADQRRSIVARGALRLLLSAYMNCSPELLLFQLGAHGKPELVSSATPVHFNVSHSGNYVLIGITAASPCGVDIELTRERRSEEAIARRFFCPAEVDWLRKTPDGFLRLWTAKEAILKATGLGLALPLNEVDVSRIVSGDDAFLTTRLSDAEQLRLWVKECTAPEGYWAAVAVCGSEALSLRFMQ